MVEIGPTSPLFSSKPMTKTIISLYQNNTQPFPIFQQPPPMAALSTGHFFKTKYISTHKYDQNKKTPRIFVPISCQGQVPLRLKTNKGEEKEEESNKGLKIMVNFEKLWNGLKESLSPKRKGDWKDLVLMSLSFAVYVYISQKLVCAYCAWTSMFKQPW